MIVFIISCATAMLVSALCSMLEAVLLSLDDIQLETRRREGHRYAADWQNMKRRIDRPIAAILILNTVAHTGGATIAGSAFDETFGAEWIWLFSVIFTLVILVGTEIIPKVVGVSHSAWLARPLAPVLKFMTVALSPVIVVTDWISRPFKKKGGRQRMSLADLRTVADMARSERLIGGQQESIIINATKLRQMTVSEVMVPADRISFFDARKPNIANFEVVAATLHTRYPVSLDGTVQGIKGYVNFKEIVAFVPSRKEVKIEPYIRPLNRTAQNGSLNDALRTLLTNREHIALVENEAHEIVGLVTLEDLLEEIVGDLTDEFDHVTDEMVHVADKRWKIGGGARLADVAERTGLLVDGVNKDLLLTNWMKQRLGRDLKAGDGLREFNASFTVLQTRRGQAHRVLVEQG